LYLADKILWLIRARTSKTAGSLIIKHCIAVSRMVQVATIFSVFARVPYRTLLYGKIIDLVKTTFSEFFLFKNNI